MPSPVPTRPRLLGLSALAATAALVVSALAVPARADDATPTAPLSPVTDVVQDVAEPTVQEALEAVETVEEAVAEPDAAETTDLTMALLEVANTRPALEGDDRAAADALLARPTNPGQADILRYDVPEQTPVCSTDICVHWVASGRHRSSRAWVDTVLDTLTQVHDTYLRAGYREPKSDGTRGGDSRLDVYLGDIGNGFYGYCTSDDPSQSRTDPARWAYCALDNDYAGFRGSPLANLQVTAAHEYYHAVQYAYDRFEDPWFLEATATWAEDELYDGVDDNRQYLRASQLRRPRTPLDTFADSGFHYGTWSFFRFLTERYRAERGGLPAVVLEMVQRAGSPSTYSWQAVDRALKARGASGKKMLAAYAVANRRPQVSYAEGRAGGYPRAPLAGDLRVGPRSPATRTLRLDHLTTATVRLRPRNVPAKRWKLRLVMQLGPRGRGGQAAITTTTRSGQVSTMYLKAGKAGRATRTVPFSGRRVRSVEVTLVNGSGRFRCYTSNRLPSYSCSGTPLDDGRQVSLRATAVR
ncbi:MXAN_6640 family putative metalloprotease [Nocardioides litoris]|uniref:MXAN_6640 family putative metalloprotease n=1 Tax=Nocardioides litoris TaxID=1926648 RepID=UPI00111F76EE|nr:MXAN_6640 family putative metalloprotease [Nocardioides litoris]